MSAIVPAEFGAVAREAAAGVLWAQWAGLGAPASPPRGVVQHSITDPEALVLASLALAKEEPRLGEMAAWWAREGPTLLSTQRMGALLAHFPGAAAEALPAFAQRAMSAGDPRWRRLAAEVPDGAGPPVRERGAGPPRLTRPSALMLRLRAGFGVGAKSDLLAVLLGMGGRPAALRVLATATGYTQRALRTAAREMAMAAFVEETQSRPAAFRAHPDAWRGLLDDGGNEEGVAPWRFWWPALAFLTAADAWAAGVEEAPPTPYLLASGARDLFERHRSAFVLNGIRHPDPGDHPGAAFLPAFAASVRALAAWAVAAPRREVSRPSGS